MAAADNPYFISPANPLQALMTGVQGFDAAQKNYKQNQMEQGRKNAMLALQNGGDLKNPLAELIGIGDVDAAKAVSTFAEHQANRQFRETEADRAQSNADRTYGMEQQKFSLTKQQAEDAAKGFEYKEVDDGQGGKTLVRIRKDTGVVERPNIPGVSQGPTSPYAPTSKLTAEESKDRGYVARMAESHKIITGLEGINQGIGGVIGGTAANRPFIRDSTAFNMMASPERQKILQAQRDFVNALLRRESGAAISQGEFENAQRQYFPQPGDTPEVLTQKRLNRMQSIEGLMGGAGRGYQPPADYVGTKGPAYPKDQAKVQNPQQQLPDPLGIR